MSADEASLEGLTNILCELYSGQSNGERLKSLQNVLVEFELQPNACGVALYYLAKTQNQYVFMYCLGVIEKTVLKKWILKDESEKLQIRQFVTTLFQSFERLSQKLDAQVIYFLQAKTSKILADIARFDWPCSFPEFFDIVLSMVSSEILGTNHFSLIKTSSGLISLRIASEEMIRPKDCFCSTRKLDLKNSLVHRASLLTAALNICAERLFGPDLISKASCLVDSGYFNPNESLMNLWPGILQLASSLFKESRGKIMGPLVRVCLNFMYCLAELFSWLPLDTPYQSRLFAVIYILSVAGSPTVISSIVKELREENDQGGWAPSHIIHISLASASCLYEVAERKEIASCLNLNANLMRLFLVTECHLSLVSGRCTLPENAKSIILSVIQPNQMLIGHADACNAVEADGMNETGLKDYHQKLIELLRQLVTNFLTVAKDASFSESNKKASFSSGNFLSLFHHFTFTTAQADTDLYFSCLRIWDSYLDYVLIRRESAMTAGIDTDSFREEQAEASMVSVALGSSVLSSMLYSDSGGILLDALEDDLGEEIDDSVEEKEEECTGLATQCGEQDDDEDTSLDLLRGLATGKNKTGGNNPGVCEYRQFLRESLLILGMVAQLTPDNLIDQLLRNYYFNHLGFLKLVDLSAVSKSGRFNLELSEHASRRLHYCLRDLATTMQALGYLSAHFSQCAPTVGQEFKKNESLGIWFLRCLVQLLQCTSIVSTSLLITESSETLIRLDIIELAAQNLSTIQGLVTSNLLVSLPSSLVDLTGKIVLSFPERDALVLELLCIIDRLLLMPSVDITNAKYPVPPRLQLHAAR
ncbi:unnamed protein product [Protopolystoma xenopodis]|uniref:Importin N-terminal domain-containing protein n=1 Tax=Protopolystoma xenopodis TaxID=117903 RepID=A0A448WFB8_9PLAT|nr:unnamed protein product [Protopolystoma xenopodis]